jgi:hypothetical protein
VRSGRNKVRCYQSSTNRVDADQNLQRSSTRLQRLSNHHCGGGAHGATGAVGGQYVTGAVAQGLQTGGAGAGHTATGAGRRRQLQMQQPALLRLRARIARISDVLFMIVSPYLQEHPLHQLRRGPRGSSLLPLPARSSRNWHSTIARAQ